MSLIRKTSRFFVVFSLILSLLYSISWPYFGGLDSSDFFVQKAHASNYDDLLLTTNGGPSYYLKFDGNLNESIAGNNPSGNPASYVSSLMSGDTGQAAYFNGTNETVFPNTTGVNSGTTYRKIVSFWLKINTFGTGTGNNARNIWEEGGGTNWFGAHTSNGDSLYISIGESNAQRGFCYESGLSTDTLYNVVMQWEGSSETLQLWIDGVKVCETTTSTGGSLASHTGDWQIGGDADSRDHTSTSIGSLMFDGYMQNYAYWAEPSRLLTQQEIEDLFNTGANLSPEISISNYFDNTKIASSTPAFAFSASDPDGTADIEYRIQIDNNSDFSSPLMDCTSGSSCANGSGSFNNLSNGADTSPFTENDSMEFIPGTAMSDGQTYYWRLSAQDVASGGGSGVYSGWTATRSITYDSSSSNISWFQTTREQFLTNTLNDVGTAGQDSVSLFSGYTNPAFENGSVSISDSLSWESVDFIAEYDSPPVIFATPATANNCEAQGSCAGNSTAGGGGMYPIPLVRNVTNTGFEISMCVNGNAQTCQTGVSAESVHWFAFDAADTENYDWIEVGTTTEAVDGNGTAINYSTSFLNSPHVWIQAQTYSQGGNLGATSWANPVSISGFTLNGCVHDMSSIDSCVSNGSDEVFGYLALDFAREDFSILSNFQTGNASLANSEWGTASFSPSFSSPKVAVHQNGESGSQRPHYHWARDVIGSGMDFRVCEQDDGTTCNTHNAEEVYWFAAEQSSTSGSGTVRSTVIDYDDLDLGDSGWDEVIWDEDETDGTLSVRVLGTNSSDCDTELISYQASSPIDLSSLDGTGTSNRICVEARLVDSGGSPVLNSWEVTWAESGGNNLPVASAVSIDSDASAVNLTENTTTGVYCSGTVSDSDGYADITSVTADFFRTSLGIGSGLDDNNHYQVSGDSECVPSDGSGTTENYTCTLDIQFFAEPTDSGSPDEADDWTCTMTPSDAGGSGTADSDTIEMNSLFAIDVDSSIDYGTINPDSDTGSSNQVTSVTNTGNRAMNIQLSGTDMTSGGDTIDVGNQEYSAAGFTYGAGTDLTGTPTTLVLDLSKPTTTTPVIGNIYWGMGVLNGQPTGTYNGINTFTATGN